MWEWLKFTYYILLVWVRGQDWYMQQKAKEQVHDAVVETVDKHDAARSAANGSGVRDDDPDLFSR